MNRYFKTGRNDEKLLAIIIIGVLLLSSVGAAITGATTRIASQPTQPSVYFFNILATASHGGGTLMINLAEHKFVFDGQGKPGRTYYLQYTLKNQSGVHEFASAAATSSGTLHMEGMWVKKFGLWASNVANTRNTQTLFFAAAAPSGNESDTLTAEPTFNVSATIPPVFAELHAYGFQQDYWIYSNGVWTVPVVFDAYGSVGMLYELYTSISYDKDNRLIYSGPSQSLNDSASATQSSRVYVRSDAAYAYADLYAYDGNGNSAHDRFDILHDVLG